MIHIFSPRSIQCLPSGRESRRGFCGKRVGCASGFGEGIGGNLFAFADRRQVPLLQFLCSEVNDR